MNTSAFLPRRLCVVATCLLLGACGTMKDLLPGERTDYKTNRDVPTLEVPPDLSVPSVNDTMRVPAAGEATTLSEYQRDTGVGTAGAGVAAAVPQQRVLPDIAGVRIERSQDKQWLVVAAPPEGLWEKLRAFWLQAGFELELDEPAIGVMETDWAENRAEIPRDAIRNLLGKALDNLYSSSTRDRYRTRLERGEQAGSSEVFITHRGVEEFMEGASPDQEAGTVWRTRPADPELEAEMLKRLALFLGEKESKPVTAAPADAAPRSRLSTAASGETVLLVDEDFSRAWRTTGIALDRSGFTVEDRDRSAGVYFVRYNDPLREGEKKSLLGRMAFWRDDEASAVAYRVEVKPENGTSLVRVLEESGAPASSGTGERILKLLQEQIR